jgi:general secretion pathway protein E
MPYLEIQTTQGRQRLELKSDPISLGRHAENTVTLQDDLASRRHCIIEPADVGWRVRDLGSRNGTNLNSSKIETELLDNGDVVKVGECTIRFIDPEQIEPNRLPEIEVFGLADEQDEDNLLDISPQPTLDIDLRADSDNPEADYERKLKELIATGIDRGFDETDISLVDNRGVTLHQATSSGLESGADGDTGESIRALRRLLMASFAIRATDIHVEPRLDGAAIRLRVDGTMLPAIAVGLTLFKRLLGLIKILCQIDTSHKNTVQDGHYSVAVKDRRVDYRVSLTPSVHGQKLVIRVLDAANAPTRLHELGMIPWMYEKLRQMANKDAGLLLACGPTGSGKTTTLYSCLREIDIEQRNAITIEDPVEYYLEGATQIPIDHKQDNTFANILRSVLRQDPDVIYVGEIRDLETATVAMQASMTGHLVYTTVHAKDSIGSIFRLLDLGIESYLVANALNLTVAQRLIRVLCPRCKKPTTPTPSQNMRMGAGLSGNAEIYIPQGCKYCHRTGFRGRRAIFELLEVNDSIRDMIMKGPSIQAIREAASQGHFMSLERYGFQCVADGLTAFDEIARVSGSDS